MQNDIVVIGANNHMAPYIAAIREEGFRTHVFAWQTGDEGELAADIFYSVSILNKEEVLDKCRAIGPAAVVAAGSDMAALTAAYVGEKLGLSGNSYSIVKRMTNKLEMRRVLERHGIPQPKFVGIEEKATFEDSRGINFPVVVKPTDRSGGRAVKRANTRYDVIQAISLAKESSFEKRAIVEEYIVGRHYSGECLSIHGKHQVIAYTCRKNIERYTCFKEHVHVQPVSFDSAMSQLAEHIIFETLDALEYSCGASSVEFVIDRNNHIKIIEVSACMYGDYISSHLVPYTTGINYMKITLQTALGQIPDFKKERLAKRAETHFVLQKSDISDYRECLEREDCEILYENIPVSDENIPMTSDGVVYGCYVIGVDEENVG